MSSCPAHKTILRGQEGHGASTGNVSVALTMGKLSGQKREREVSSTIFAGRVLRAVVVQAPNFGNARRYAFDSFVKIQLSKISRDLLTSSEKRKLDKIREECTTFCQHTMQKAVCDTLHTTMTSNKVVSVRSFTSLTRLKRTDTTTLQGATYWQNSD